MTPNDPNDVKKLFNFGIDDPLAFGLDLMTLKLRNKEVCE